MAPIYSHECEGRLAIVQVVLTALLQEKFTATVYVMF